jgi:hypothetical protein
MAFASVIIALLSFTVSGIALFFAQFRGPQISNVIGPTIEIYYPFDGGFGVYVPATFVNSSARTGTVQRCGITLFRKSDPDEKFFMEWRYFAKLQGEGSEKWYELYEAAHAVAVLATSSVATVPWFTWRQTSRPELTIREGGYVIIFHCWLGSAEKPHNNKHEFHIDKQTQAELDQYRSNNQGTTVKVLLDNRIPGNRLLTSQESNTLLGI